jgi:hypothetical protein
MNIALYHGLHDIHFEMLGYFIEYIKYSNISINIYAIANNATGIEWKKYYEEIFNKPLKWNDPSLFNPSNYDLIILLTDDDKSFNEAWLEEFGNKKVICIDHCGLIRRNNVKFRIGTRFFNRRPNTPWVLPCYYGINKLKKYEILYNQEIENNKIKILCIGIQNRPPNIEFLTNLFENFEDIEFHIIARFFNSNYNTCKNIITYEMCPTDIMFNLAKKSNYILCIDNPLNPFPIANSMSGAIPIAFSFGCQLILPYSWQQCYNFKSSIFYKDITKIKLSHTTNLDCIYNELYDLILHRNKLFDNIFKNNLNLIKNNNNWQTKILSILDFPIPSIYFSIDNDVTDLQIINLQNDFRELHILNNSNNLYISNNNYIFIHENYNIINQLNDAVLFEINNLSLNIISILGKRNHKDIIIFNKCDNIDEIINIYNRQCIYYNYENKIILISQR